MCEVAHALAYTIQEVHVRVHCELGQGVAVMQHVLWSHSSAVHLGLQLRRQFAYFAATAECIAAAKW